jgi:ABC-type transport system involved in multi-copper enzyme maturation permease subunit
VPVLTIARLTLLEITRRRLLLAAVVVSALVVGLTGWGFAHLNAIPCGGHACSVSEIRTASGAVLILVMFMFSFVLAVGAAFLAAPTIAADVESGVIFAVLPRPIRRSDIVLGKWLGLTIVLIVYGACFYGCEIFIDYLATGYTPPHPLAAIVFLVAEGIVLMTLALLGSTRLPPMTVGITVLVLYGLVWMGGVAGAVGQAIQNGTATHVGTVTSLLIPTDGLWRGALYNLEPVALLIATGSAAAANPGNAPFAVFAPPTSAYTAWVVCWLIAVLGLSVWSFQGRDL